MAFLGFEPLVACAVAMSCFGGPAHPPVPETALTLAVYDQQSAVSIAYLECEPARGTHPDAEDACDALEAARGDFDRLPPKTEQPCPAIYAPVTAEARGHWRGEPVVVTKTYPNRCVAGAESGGVFAL